MSDMDAGMIIDAPNPCAKRAAISAFRFGAMPQASEAAIKIASPQPMAWRAPRRSLNAPDESRSLANTKVYPSTTH
jgi:hypothetical protein